MDAVFSSKKRPFSNMTPPSSPNSTPPAKIQRLDAITFPISDETHAEQDQRILTFHFIKHIPDELDVDSAYFLLQTIARVAGDSMNHLSISKLEDLVKTEDGLIAELQDAWSKRSFAGIRTLRILQNPNLISKVSFPKRALGILNREVLQNAIASAWNLPYEGIHHSLLYNNIKKMTRSKPYSNSVAVIQSSGTGKSRMVHEQSKLVFTIPFNLRGNEDDKDLPFPPADTVVRNHLVETAPKKLFLDLQVYYLVFLRCLFQEGKKELEENLYKAKNVAATKDAPQALALTWHEHLETGARKHLYQKVVESASCLPLVAETTLGKHRANHAALKSMEPLQLYTATVEVQREFMELLSTMDRLEKPSENLDVLYDVLCSCFNALLDKPVFAIYLSTKSHLEKFAPSHELAKSARARENVDALQAPITEVPFDCSKNLYIHPGQYTLKETCTVEFMAKFGRPMFWTLIEGAGSRRSEVIAGMIDFARAKLICNHNINLSHTDLTREGRLAVLDVRLMLTWEPKRDAFRTQSNLIASHMRMAYSFPKDHVHSGYSSEPILCEAAAQQLYIFRQNSKSADIDILKENLQNGLLDLGERGELVARAIITSAYDRAVERDHPPKIGDTPFYSQGCSVITFIQELFSEEYAEEILDSVPDNTPDGKPFREAFATAKIRFTHFVKMADDTSTSTEAMFAAFIRGMAIICASGQPATDILIPVLLIDGPLGEEVMSSLMVQIKQKKKQGTSADIAAANAALRPYITLIMDLGVQRPNTQAKTPFKVHELPQPKPKPKPKSKSKPKPKRETTPKGKSQEGTPSRLDVSQPGQLHHPNVTHPRYSIYAYGCSNKVYKGIYPDDKAKYAFLLASRNFLGEHPRQNIESLNALCRMKPLWAAGKEYYHWLESGLLNSTEVTDDFDVAWLVTGDSMVDEVVGERYN
ncbi:hypothetical protein K439DRAFT_1656117 [Ramaria rubella]|nr:hypothetical protein K439DRAFT_1656117 [Ramaria rubella]